MINSKSVIRLHVKDVAISQLIMQHVQLVSVFMCKSSKLRDNITVENIICMFLQQNIMTVITTWYTRTWLFSLLRDLHPKSLWGVLWNIIYQNDTQPISTSCFAWLDSHVVRPTDKHTHYFELNWPIPDIRGTSQAYSGQRVYQLNIHVISVWLSCVKWREGHLYFITTTHCWKSAIPHTFIKESTTPSVLRRF